MSLRSCSTIVFSLFGLALVGCGGDAAGDTGATSDSSDADSTTGSDAGSADVTDSGDGDSDDTSGDGDGDSGDGDGDGTSGDGTSGDGTTGDGDGSGGDGDGDGTTGDGDGTGGDGDGTSGDGDGTSGDGDGDSGDGDGDSGDGDGDSGDGDGDSGDGDGDSGDGDGDSGDGDGDSGDGDGDSGDGDGDGDGDSGDGDGTSGDGDGTSGGGDGTTGDGDGDGDGTSGDGDGTSGDGDGDGDGTSGDGDGTSGDGDGDGDGDPACISACVLPRATCDATCYDVAAGCENACPCPGFDPPAQQACMDCQESCGDALTSCLSACVSDYDGCVAACGGLGSANVPPGPPGVRVTTDPLAPLGTATCSLFPLSFDPNGDPVTYSFDWFVGSTFVASTPPEPGNPTVSTYMPSGDTGVDALEGEDLRCVVTPNDGLLDGPTGEGSAMIGCSTIRVNNPTQRPSILAEAPDTTAISLGATFSQDITLEFWFRPSSIGSARYLIWKGPFTPSDADVDYGVSLATTGEIEFSTGPTATDPCNQLLSTTALTAGAWTHVSVNWDGTGTTAEKRIYLDGVLDASCTATEKNPSTQSNATIFGTTNDRFDDMHIFKNQARSADFIAPIRPLPIPPNITRALFYFDDAAANSQPSEGTFNVRYSAGTGYMTQNLAGPGCP